MDPTDLKKQRDRFLGFAFASADLFMEIDESEKVVFALGAAKSLAGIDDQALTGQHWLNIFGMSDRMLLAGMMRKAKDGERCGPIAVMMDDRLAAGRRAIVTGIRMPGSDSFFLTVGFFNALSASVADEVRSGGDVELLDRDTFLYTAKEALDIARGVGQNLEMTMIDIGNDTALQKKFGDGLWNTFKMQVAGVLGRHSVDGQTVAEIGNGRYTIIHDKSIDADALRTKINDAALEIDPLITDFAATAKTVSADLQSLSDREAMKALIYTVNEFERKGMDMNIETLNGGFKAYVSANAQKIHEFKAIVSRFEFDFAFQPLVYLADGSLSHYEMLCRFHAEGNTQEWVIFGEDIGMAPDFDIAICERAINYLLYKAQNNRTKFAVNLSGQSLQNENFFRTLMAKLSLHKELAPRLIFEITESTNIEQLEMVNNFVKQLQKAGHKVCLDDFGSGSASFQYLQQLQVDYVKIDGAYTQRILDSSRDATLLRSLTQMCKDLNVGVAAERIETAAEAEMLRDMGVQIGQGYYFGKPQPKPDYVAPSVAAA